MKKIYSLILTSCFLLLTGIGFAQVAGTNTIDATGTNFSGNPGGVSGKNWTSFNNAVTALQSYGVSGAVVFNVATNTYTEQVTIKAITNASSSSTITFQSAALDSTKVTLTYASASSSANYTLQFNGAAYFIFKKITITNSNTSYSRVVDIANSAHDIQLLNNRINGYNSANTADQYATIYCYSGTTSNNMYNITIKQNVINYGSYGIDYYGPGTYGSSGYGYGISIQNNQITNFGYYGVYTYYTYQPYILSNTITSSNNAAGYGIYNYYTYYTYIQNNTINLSATSTNTAYGIYTYYNYYSYCQNNTITVTSVSSNTCYATYLQYGYYGYQVTNNTITMTGGSGAKYGLYVSYCYYGAQVNFNTVTVTGTSTQYGMYVYYCYQDNGGVATKILNNKVTVNGASSGTTIGFYSYMNYGTSATVRTLTANNMIMISNSTSTTYGMYWYYGQYADVIGNSISVTSTYTSGYALYTYLTSGYPDSKFYDNIVSNTGGGYCLYLSDATAVTGWDNNDYWCTGSNFAYLNLTSTTYSNFATFQNKFVSNDLSSQNINPGWVNFASDLHTTNLNLQYGIPWAGMTTDFDGQTRSTGAPFVGCDELFANQTYSTCTTLQNNTTPVLVGSWANDIIAVKVNMMGGLNPFKLTQLTMNTTGTSKVSDIFKARVFFTGGKAAFDTTSQYGSTIAAPSGVMVFSGSVTLNPGPNYFWLSYGIASGALFGDSVDAQCTQVNLDSAGNAKYKTPAVTNPAGARIVMTPMSGTYTINPSGSGLYNYLTFNAAVSDLVARHVVGACTFLVSANSFNERVVIPNIIGTSRLNSVSFIGAGTAKTTLTWAGTATSTRATLVLNGCSYVTFKKMTINNTGASYGAAVFLYNYASYNLVDSCYLAVPVTTSSSYIVYYMSLSEGSQTSAGYANYNILSNSTVYGGYYGAILYGTSGSTSTMTNNEIDKCTFNQVYYYGIYNYYAWYTRIYGNTITNFYNGSSTSSYGIYSYYGQYTYIVNNIVQAGYYGLYVYQENTYATAAYTEIYNNMISNFSYTNYHYGVYILYDYYTKFDHNSIWTNVLSGTSYYTAYIIYYTGSEFKNNIFYSQSAQTSNYALYFSYGNTPNAGVVDFNDYYAANPGANFVYWNGTTFTNLAALQTAYPTYNAGSVSVLPQFISYSNLHLAANATPMGGPFLSNVAFDIDGQPRGPSFAMLGADEIPLPNAVDADIVAMTGPTLTNNNGPNTITIQLYNRGRNTIPAGNIYLQYQVGSKPVQKDTMVLASNWTPLSSQYFSFHRPWVITTGGLYHIKFMINPVVKGDPDTIAGGISVDSFSVNKQTSFSAGTYYIDSSRTIPGSFPNFTTANNALKSGILGQVKFIVTKGTYTEQIDITPVFGASAANNVSFESQSGNPKDVILTYYYATASNNYTLRLNGSPYITFKNITIATLGYNSYHRVIDMESGAQYCNFTGCIINGITSTMSTEDFDVIYSPNSADVSWSTFTGNTINGGYYGLRLYGNSSSGKNTVGIIIDNNIFNGFYYYGIYAYYLESLTITNNTMINYTGSTNSAIAMYLYYIDYSINAVNNMPANGISKINYNTIKLATTSQMIGLYEYYVSYGAQTIGNNITIAGASTSTNYAMYIYYCNYYGNGNTYSKNRIYLNSTGSSTNYGMYIYYCYTNGTAMTNLVSDNFVVQQYGSGTQYGIYNYYSGNYYIYHNSININTGSSSSYGLYFYCGTTSTNYLGGDCKANLVVMNNGGYCIYLYGTPSSGTCPITGSNYNNFVTNGSYIGICSSSYTTLSAWKTGVGFDASSISVNPGWTSPTLLYPTNTAVNIALSPFTLVPDDIDGIKRVNPITIGAANLIYSLDVGVTAVAYPYATICAGPALVQVKMRNFGATQIDSVQLKWWISGTAQTTYMFKGPLAMLHDTVISIGTYVFTPGTYSLSVKSASPNSGVDGNLLNDSIGMATIKVVGLPSIPTGKGDTICQNSSARLHGYSATKNYIWYDAATGGNTLGTDSILKTAPLAATTTFYLAAGSVGAPTILSTTALASANMSDNGFMFDIQAKKSDIKIDSIALYPSNIGSVWFKVCYKSGSYSGNMGNPYAWTVDDSVMINITSVSTPIYIPIFVTVPKGTTYGFYVTSMDPFYSLMGKTGTATFQDSNISLTGGNSIFYPFSPLGSLISLFSGKLYYEGRSLCSSARIPVTAVVHPAAALNVSVNSASQCITGNNFAFYNLSTSVDKVKDYYWNFGDNPTYYHVTDTNHIYLTPGNYSVKLFAVTVLGCLDSLVKPITVNANPIADAGPDKFLNCGDSAQLGMTATLGMRYRWSPITGLKDTTVSNPWCKPIVKNRYVLTVKNLTNGCTSTDDVMVTITNSPKATISPDTNICLGGSAIIKASGGITYKWSNGPTTPIINPSPTVTTQYTVTVWGSGICTDQATMTVYVRPLPIVNFSSNASGMCLAGNNFIYYNKSTISSGTNTYKWYFGDGLKSTKNDTVMHTYLTDGTYPVKLIATSNWGCMDSNSKTITVYPMPKPLFSVNDTSQCQKGSNFIYTNNSTIKSGSFVNFWYFGDGSTSNAANPTHVYTNPGTYKVKLVTISTTYGCVDSVKKTNSMKPTAFAAYNVNDSLQCMFHNSFLFVNKSTLSSGTATYHWTLGDGNFSTSSTTITHSYTKPGIYPVQLVTTTNRGCKDSTIINMEVYAMPVVTLGPDTTIVGKASLKLDPGAGYTSYLWTTGDTTEYIIIDSTGAHAPSYKSYGVTVTDNHGCWGVATIRVHFTRTGIAGNPNGPDVTVYPNPTEGLINIHFTQLDNEKVDVTVLNAQGKVITQQSYKIDPSNTTKQIDLSNQAKGMYFIRFNWKGESYTEKFLVR